MKLIRQWRSIRSLEEFVCRDATIFLAASLRKPKCSEPTTLRDSTSLEAYIAGSAKRKLSLAESSKSIRSSYSSLLPGTILKGPGLLLPPALLADPSATKLECTRKPPAGSANLLKAFSKLLTEFSDFSKASSKLLTTLSNPLLYLNWKLATCGEPSFNLTINCRQVPACEVSICSSWLSSFSSCPKFLTSRFLLSEPLTVQ